MYSEDDELNVNTTQAGDETLDNIDVIGDGLTGVDEDLAEVECNKIVPTVGMMFSDDVELLEFYKRYAYRVGFPVRKRSSRKGTDGLVKYTTYTCGREDRRDTSTSSSLKPQPLIRNGCQARMTAMVDVSGRWVVTKVILEHNHQTSPSKSRLYRCNRHLSEHVKRKLEVNDIAGIPMHKSYNSAVVEARGYDQITFGEKDCRNYIDKVRRLRLGEGDAITIQSYFSKMQANCPDFYFILDLDDECRLMNVFWFDNRSREAYKEFGDVVTFDTTYLTNKYDMSFAPFVAVNHHGHSILLGCGLLSNEDTETFVWIFRTWLECMEGKAPSGIQNDVTTITEQYLIRIWRRGVRRHYNKVKINCNEWITTPEQVRYDQMCRMFCNVADVASEDEDCTLKIMKWLEVQMSEMSVVSSCVPTVNNQYNDLGDAPICVGSFKDSNDNVLDHVCSKTKGAPRKNCEKGPLETTARKSKVQSKAKKVQNKDQGDASNAQQICQSSTLGQIPSFTPFSYSLPNMIVPPEAYGLHFMNVHPTNQQLLSIYARPPRPEDQDISRRSPI